MYSGRYNGNGLYGIQSSDGGDVWSEPTPLFLTNNPEIFPSNLQLYRDSVGNVHAVWSLVDFTGNSQAIYYSRLGPDTTHWISPVELAKASNF